MSQLTLAPPPVADRSNVVELRPIVNALDQARKLGTNTTMAVVRRVRQEQREGRSGEAVARELQARRLRPETPTPPEAA